MKAMWSPAPIASIIDRYDSAQQVLRVKESRNTSLRIAFEPIWACLAAVSSGEFSALEHSRRPIANAVRELYESRRKRYPDEAARFALSLSNIPEADVLQRLAQLTPEQRVREFDRIIASLNNVPKNDVASRHMFAMISAYLATVAAGGEASLSLLEPHAGKSPELVAWAYVLGSVGERVVWTSAFDGLGRLVARELMRPLHFDESPTCDFSIDEAMVLFDNQLPDPLVHLRIKQSRIATISLAPGVNIQVPLADSQLSNGRGAESVSQKERMPADSFSRSQELEVIVDAVWRRLRGRVEEHIDLRMREENRRSGKRAAWQQKLPLKGSEEK